MGVAKPAEVKAHSKATRRVVRILTPSSMIVLHMGILTPARTVMCRRMCQMRRMTAARTVVFQRTWQILKQKEGNHMVLPRLVIKRSPRPQGRAKPRRQHEPQTVPRVCNTQVGLLVVSERQCIQLFESRYCAQ